MESQVSSSGPRVQKNGWLEKSPPISKFSRFKCYKKRFFVLSKGDALKDFATKKGCPLKDVENEQFFDHILVYWETEDTEKKAIKAIPILPTYHVSKFPVYDNAPKKNMFSLATAKRVYMFSATNEGEMESWYHSLKSAIENTRTKKRLSVLLY